MSQVFSPYFYTSEVFTCYSTKALTFLLLVSTTNGMRSRIELVLFPFFFFFCSLNAIVYVHNARGKKVTTDWRIVIRIRVCIRLQQIFFLSFQCNREEKTSLKNSFNAIVTVDAKMFFFSLNNSSAGCKNIFNSIDILKYRYKSSRIFFSQVAFYE